MAGDRLACRECHAVAEPDEDTCPICGSTSLTEDWSGFVIIAHPDESQIAEEMEVTEPGKYALKVR
jgi:DNA-directed RNA polymerase subunit E"